MEGFPCLFAAEEIVGPHMLLPVELYAHVEVREVEVEGEGVDVPALGEAVFAKIFDVVLI